MIQNPTSGLLLIIECQPILFFEFEFSKQQFFINISEAKMKMRNIGRETITSAGPNSFGKTKQGFCDDKKLFEKRLQDAMDRVCDD
jgi:hypothetical protein